MNYALIRAVFALINAGLLVPGLAITVICDSRAALSSRALAVCILLLFLDIPRIFHILYSGGVVCKIGYMIQRAQNWGVYNVPGPSRAGDDVIDFMRAAGANHMVIADLVDNQFI